MHFFRNVHGKLTIRIGNGRIDAFFILDCKNVDLRYSVSIAVNDITGEIKSWLRGWWRFSAISIISTRCALASFRPAAKGKEQAYTANYNQVEQLFNVIFHSFSLFNA